jgi:hypothetical protein
MLRAWRRDGALASMTYQLYVSSRYGGGHWRFYNRAYDSDGRQLPLTKIASDVQCHRDGCAYFEDVALEVTESYLQEHATSGIRIQISGPGGKERLTLPPAYVAAFLRVSRRCWQEIYGEVYMLTNQSFGERENTAQFSNPD